MTAAGANRVAADLPSVSVVIPVKNDAEMLARCLDALARQSLAPREVIVVDNGSSDASIEVARTAGARVLHQPESGIPAASSMGYDAARGEVIARLDADCVAPPDWVATITELFARDEALGAVTGSAFFIDGPRYRRMMLPRIYLGAYHVSLAPALGHRPLFGSNMAMRNAVWRCIADEIHRHDPEVHDDLDVAFHLGQRHRIRHERALSMGISGRPFDDLGDFLLRIRRGFHTVGVHWPQEFPPLRWSRMALAARQAVPDSALRLPASSTSPAGSSWCPPNCRRIAESSWLA